ncbi:MAG: hypothetical protein WCT04_13850 [Planctomycetota bacterium]
MRPPPSSLFASLRTAALCVWCLTLVAAMIWARGHERTEAPPTRADFEERHRVCYDIYASSDSAHAYDLLAQAFNGNELDRQYCLYAKSAKQLVKAGANVTVWDLQYQDFKIIASAGNRCTVYSKWNVVFVLGHTQHSHVRSNAYEAVFELIKDANGWRVTSSRIVNENTLA